MSWIQKLYETYENCQSMVGVVNAENQVPLLPICHNTQQAQIEIVIDQDGNFKRARVVSKDDATTVIPCTESSGGRAGKKPVNHPLCDKLQYIAGDFINYGGVVTTGYAKKPQEPYESYYATLEKWCESEYSHPKAKAILKYVGKGSVIKDLVESQVLHLGTTGKLLEKWDKSSLGSKYIAALAQGSAARAYALAFHPLQRERSEFLCSLLSTSGISPGEMTRVFAKIEELFSKEEEGSLDWHKDVELLLAQIFMWYRDLYLLKMGGDPNLLYFLDKLPLLQKRCLYSFPSFDKLHDIFEKARLGIERNIKLKVVLEYLFLELGIL